MKITEKIKVQKIIRKIESGIFDENDIDNFFMKLRAYSADYRIFREVADFVAHNDERNKGIVNESLEAFYFSIKYFIEYVTDKTPLEIINPFPLYIKKLMKYQIDKCKERDLINKFKLNRIKMKSLIDNLFSENKKDNVAQLRKIKISKKDSKIIEYLLGFIGSIPAFEQKDLTSDILNVMKLNDLEFNEKDFLTNFDKIVLCVLLLLNASKFKFDNGITFGYTNISSKKEYLPYNIEYRNEEGENFIPEVSFGYLHINGNISIQKKDNSKLNVIFPLFLSTLSAEEWCSNKLFCIEPLNSETPLLMYKKIKFDSELILSDDFKITKIDK